MVLQAEIIMRQLISKVQIKDKNWTKLTCRMFFDLMEKGNWSQIRKIANQKIECETADYWKCLFYKACAIYCLDSTLNELQEIVQEIEWIWLNE